MNRVPITTISQWASPASAQAWREAVHRLVEDHVDGRVVWHGEYAECQCPLGHDAHVYIDRTWPHLHCLHERCESEVRDVNNAMREAAACLPEAPVRLIKTPAEKAAEAFKLRLRRLERYAHEYTLPALRRTPIPVEHWTRTSPFPVDQYPVEEHWLLYLGTLYPPKSLVWAGELHESGRAYRRSFRGPLQWLREPEPPGQFVSVFTFGGIWESGERSLKNTDKRVLQVLESDTESRETFGAVIKYAQKFMRLRAVVDTGGKSLHAAFDPFEKKWVQFPPQPQHEIYQKMPCGLPGSDGYYIATFTNPNYASESAAWEAKYGSAWKAFWRQQDLFSDRRMELNAILAGLGCDKQMLTTALTTRLPGHPRLDEEGIETGRFQQLLYLDPTYPV